MTNFSGPPSKEADWIHADKHRQPNESYRDYAGRVAGALQDSPEHFRHFRHVIGEQWFLPGGRIQRGAGSSDGVTSHNCFVMGTIHDSFVHGPDTEELIRLGRGEHPPVSIMQTAVEAAATMRMGGGVGYDISTLRPGGDSIHGVNGITDGPLAFAPIYDATCKATSSAGNRRGAQMLVMRIDHPDIEKFIRAKQVGLDIPFEMWPYEYRPLRGFNMSVAVTDEFLMALEKGTSFPLRFARRVYREIDPRALWDLIMRGTYDYADPGVIFIDTINEMNNLWYCEHIAATNPCGEQPLPPYGACLLGSINATKFITPSNEWDITQLEYAMPHIVRAMDNVIDRSKYPLPQQELEAKSKRRMGIGVTGVANAIESMGQPYGTRKYLELQDQFMYHLNRTAYLASIELAKEKGAFNMFDAELYCEGRYIKGLEDDLQEQIRRYGIRNSHLTSVAPTGTISMTAGNISSGVEPTFSRSQARRVIGPNGPVVVELEDYGVRFLGSNPRKATEVSPEEHVKVVCHAQKYVDSAVSKTVNCPADISYENFKDLYLQAWEGGAKGMTTYRPNEVHPSVITDIDDDQGSEVCAIGPDGRPVGPCAEE